jgi:hypothetical protein
MACFGPQDPLPSDALDGPARDHRSAHPVSANPKRPKGLAKAGAQPKPRAPGSPAPYVRRASKGGGKGSPSKGTPSAKAEEAAGGGSLISFDDLESRLVAVEREFIGVGVGAEGASAGPGSESEQRGERGGGGDTTATETPPTHKPAVTL